MRLTPLHDFVIVKRIPAETTSPGGIALVDAEEDGCEAIVLAVGPGKRVASGERDPLTVKAGDRVGIKNFVGTLVRVDGEELVVAREDDLFGVFEA